MDSPHRNDSPCVIIPPPLIYGIFFLVGTTLEYVIPIPAFLPYMIARVVGWMLAIASLFFAIPGMQSFYAARTTIMPHKAASSLVTRGIFTITRNPLYVSLLFLYAGVGVHFNLWWPIILIPFLIAVMDRLVIAREEAYLTRRFGDEYQNYRTRVRRWL